MRAFRIRLQGCEPVPPFIREAKELSSRVARIDARRDQASRRQILAASADQSFIDNHQAHEISSRDFIERLDGQEHAIRRQTEVMTFQKPGHLTVQQPLGHGEPKGKKLLQPGNAEQGSFMLILDALNHRPPRQLMPER